MQQSRKRKRGTTSLSPQNNSRTPPSEPLVPAAIATNRLPAPAGVNVHQENVSFNAGGNIQQTIATYNTYYSSGSAGIPAPSILIKPPLPSAPKFMFGRDKEKEETISLLLKPRARVAILGDGGMGKTTLALSALHDGQVYARYPSRYFVSCEAVSSLEDLLVEFADTVRVDRAVREKDVYGAVLSALRNSGHAVLCLDNFEPVWDDTDRRKDVEEFLSHVDAISDLALIITMRGSQRPQNVSWSKPLLKCLAPLSWQSAIQIFEEVFGAADTHATLLLREMDGIPLAIELIASMLREGNESSASLWARWEATHTEAVELGDTHRLSNLEASIHLSVHSPRVSADPNAIHILAMLSLLPAGLLQDISKLQKHVPPEFRLDKSLLTLKRVSLIHLDNNVTPHRLRLLSPIRHFCVAKLTVPASLDSGLVSFYIDMLKEGRDYTNPLHHIIIRPELPNIHAVLMRTADRKWDAALVKASICYTKWAWYVGQPVEEVILMAVNNSSLLQKADSLRCLYTVYIDLHKLDKAEEVLVCAVDLYRQTHNVLGEANALRNLGDLCQQKDRLDDAEKLLHHAVDLYRQAHSARGQAYVLKSLGDLCLRRSKLDDAEKFLHHAIDLFQQVQDVLGEANALQRLGDLCLWRDRLDDAEKFLHRAVDLSRQAQDVLGEANALESLGDMCLRKDRLDDAEKFVHQAVDLYRKSHSVLGEANAHQRLGDLCLRRDRLDDAEKFLHNAVDLYQQIQDVLGEANALKCLGDLCLRRDRLDEAEKFLHRAVDLSQQAQDVLCEANALKRLGDLCLRQDRLDNAEKFLHRAVDLHR